MFDAFPYDSWDGVTGDFWTYGGAGSTGTWILTILGIALMVMSLIGFVRQETRRLERAAARVRSNGLLARDATHDTDERVGGTMAGKQIEFPPEQTNDKRVAPFMLALSVVCIVIVVVMLLAGAEGSFIGPW